MITHLLLLAVALLRSCSPLIFTKYDHEAEIEFYGSSLEVPLSQSTYRVTWLIKNNVRKRVMFKQFMGSEDTLIIREHKIGGVGRTYRPNSYIEPFISHSYINITLFGTYSRRTESLILKFSYKQWCEPCGFTAVLQEGDEMIVQSPSYPNLYYSGCQCYWHFSAAVEKQVIEVEQKDFRLPPKSTNGKCSDFLEVFKGEKPAPSSSLGQFCGGDFIKQKVQGERDSRVVLLFHSLQNGSYTDDMWFGFQMQVSVKKEEALASLQSVAAILGAISFGIFIGLLLCSIFYKRWSNDTDTNVQADIPEPENDYDDVIQAAAPPSYRKVMDSPNLFPISPSDTPRITSSSLQIPATDPPKYPGEETLPSYISVSESEDEWFSLKRMKRNRTPPRDPPSYQEVTSEGSEPRANQSYRKKAKTRGRLPSRTERTSTSCYPQARDEDSDSETEENAGNRKVLRTSVSRLSNIESSSSEGQPPQDLTIPAQRHCSDDLVRQAIHNSIHRLSN